MQSVLNYILSTGFINSILRMSTPLLFSCMGAVIVRRAGISCIAFESMMLFGALGGALGSGLSGSIYVGIIVALLCSMIIAALFAYFVLELKADNMLVGLALNTLGSGGTAFILYMITGNNGSSLDLLSSTFPNINIPFISSIPILGEILSGRNLLTYVAFLTVPLVYILLYKTSIGLRIRVVGESPDAAKSLGISVNKTRFLAMLIAGFLAGFGGMFMSMGYLKYFIRDMVAGRGFMALAAMNLGGAQVFPAMIWTLVFGATNAIATALQAINLPPEFLQLMPYLSTVIGLAILGISENISEQKLHRQLIAKSKMSNTSVSNKQ